MGDPDFGEPCRTQIISKLQRRQANWKLDPPLRKACKSAVRDLCKDEEQQNSEAGLVYKCLLRNYMDLDDGCQKVRGSWGLQPCAGAGWNSGVVQGATMGPATSPLPLPPLTCAPDTVVV